MRSRIGIVWVLAATAAMAQEPTINAAVSGVVKDAGTGQPLEGYIVSTSVHAKWVNDTIYTSKSTKDVSCTTDAQGHYRLGDLPPGDYRIDTRSGPQFTGAQTRAVTLNGHDVDGIDFNVKVPGVITGQVIDENREPMPGMSVYLVSREYYDGVVGYFLKGVTTTDDRGRYTLSRVESGHPYLVLADRRELRLPAHSDAPLNPKLRRPVPMRTWYPNSPMPDTAVAIVLRSGEHREGVNIEIKKSPSYCLDGALTTPTGPSALFFSIAAERPSSGISSGGGMFIAPPGGTAGADGKVRICDLAPGTYRLSADKSDSQGGHLYGVTEITIADRDVENAKLAAVPGRSIEGEVVWDGPPPNSPVTAKMTIWLQPLFRAGFQGENSSARTDIPATFSIPNLLTDVYHVQPMLNVDGLYVKEITYGGNSVLHSPLQLGSAMNGVGMRVVLGYDGATVSARVADKDGNPVGDAHIVVMPAEIASEAMLADTMFSGLTNQLGTYTSHTLAPGKYLVFASSQTFDATPESISKLWRSRNRFTEVQLSPKGTAQVNLEPITIE